MPVTASAIVAQGVRAYAHLAGLLAVKKAARSNTATRALLYALRRAPTSPTLRLPFVSILILDKAAEPRVGNDLYPKGLIVDPPELAG